MVTAEEVEAVAKQVTRWPEHREWDTRDKDKRFVALFGVKSEIVATLWDQIEAQAPMADGAQLKHLLWALVHLKVCGNEETNSSLVGWPAAKTFAKWAWHFVERIHDLKDEVTDLEDRFEGLGDVANTNCFITVDGTDCPVFEPCPWNKDMHSKKFNGPGLEHEVAVCIATGRIVWINGPFKAGVNDTTIFEQGLKTHLFAEEAVEVDRGCGGDDAMKTPEVGLTSEDGKTKSVARAQHEAVNSRSKQFNVLSTHFRHMKPNKEGMMEKHGLCFFAVAVLAQLKFRAGESVFDEGVDCNVDHFQSFDKHTRG